jgi:hypothetical protein
MDESRIVGAGATREGEQGIREALLRACERTAMDGRAVAMRHGWLDAIAPDAGQAG